MPLRIYQNIKFLRSPHEYVVRIVMYQKLWYAHHKQYSTSLAVYSMLKYQECAVNLLSRGSHQQAMFCFSFWHVKVGTGKMYRFFDTGVSPA
jgi:hypothetical protein